MLPGLRGERAPPAQPLGLGLRQLSRELGDERGHVSQLAEPAEPLQRRELVVEKPLFDDRHGEIPAVRLDCGGQFF